jgi:protoporphyrinogen oxidase
MSHYVVVGAGVAGLTIAHQLAATGHPVTVVERDGVVGGLARSWHYGDFHFDVGPHRFHTENARVAAFIREILAEDVREIPRRSGVRMFGEFHEWPLRPGILLSMPFSLMVRGAFDLLRREHLDGESFEADIVNKYGRTLYSIFFEPYTRKFNFASPAELHQDWGRAGVNRAVIDKRAGADSLWSLLKTTLLPKPVETTFLYPPTGVGIFSEKLAESIVACGGRVVLQSPVTGLEYEGGRVTAVTTAKERIACEGVVWTAPLTLATTLLGMQTPDLDYLSTVFYNFEINAPDRIGFQWTYYGGDEVFSRASCPVAFAPTMAPAGKSSLCVEVTCRQGDGTWSRPDSLTDRVIADLIRTETIRCREDIGALHIERVPETYPIYSLPYLAELTRSLRQLGQFANLLMAGRTGRFWYNNMDHSIGQGLTMADKILRGQALAEVDSADREFWKDGTDVDADPVSPM